MAYPAGRQGGCCIPRIASFAHPQVLTPPDYLPNTTGLIARVISLTDLLSISFNHCT